MRAQRVSPPSPWGGVELLERAIGYTRSSLALVTPDLMSAPTPCDGWDLRALLAHMHDSLTSLHEAGSSRQVGTGAPPPPPADLVTALCLRACQLLGEWSSDWELARTSPGLLRDVVVDGRPVTVPVLTSAGALEVAVHGWDVATACGARRPVPDRLANDLLRIAPALVTEADRPARFGPALRPPFGASPGERLLAYLGREPA